MKFLAQNTEVFRDDSKFLWSGSDNICTTALADAKLMQSPALLGGNSCKKDIRRRSSSRTDWTFISRLVDNES